MTASLAQKTRFELRGLGSDCGGPCRQRAIMVAGRHLHALSRARHRLRAARRYRISDHLGRGLASAVCSRTPHKGRRIRSSLGRADFVGKRIGSLDWGASTIEMVAPIAPEFGDSAMSIRPPRRNGGQTTRPRKPNRISRGTGSSNPGSLQRRVCLSPQVALVRGEPRLSARVRAAGLAPGSAETLRVFR